MSSGYVLGISGLYHDSAAALVGGGRIVAAAQEERFTRRKGDRRFPDSAIRFCLQHLPAGRSLDAVAFYEDPALKVERIIHNALAQAPRGAPIWPDTLSRLDELNGDLPKWLRGIVDDPARIRFVPHHRSHAASAFYPSPFDRAAVLVVDGVGEWSTTSIWAGENGTLRPVREMRFPHSLGLLYSAFTQYCGFKVNSGEQKLMGLAPFGNPVFADRILGEIVALNDDGSFVLDMSYFGFHTSPGMISPLLGYLFGVHARLPEEPITQHFMDVAASIQAVTNEIMRRLARSALELTGMRHLCLAGGVALNCVANTAILRNVDGLDGIWIQPAAGDAGGAIGAALDVAHAASPAPSKSLGGDGMSGAYLGPGFNDAEIEAALAAKGLVYQRVDDDEIVRRIAEHLNRGDIVGHFDGRMEFGPRALGNRSILADPRSAGTLGRVNQKIKFREGWRPFAPIVLTSHAAEIFDAPTESPYMMLVSHLKAELRDGPTVAELRGQGIDSLSRLQECGPADYASVTHVDYSSRIQTIDATSLSRAGRILKSFHDLTGFPMLLNTSFNVRGEPIVCTPADAVDCFLNTNLDMLAIGHFLVERSTQPPALVGRAGKKKFDAD